MLLETTAMNFRKVRSVNATDTSFPSKVPTITEPAGDAGTATGQAVVDLINGKSSAPVQNLGKFIFYGTGDENDVFAARIIGWTVIRGVQNVTKDLWIPVVLAELTCTMSATPGIALAAVLSTELFVDTLVLVTGNEDVSIDIVSPTADEIAHCVVDLKGFQKVEVTFDTTTGDPSGCNALVSLY